MFTNKHVIIAMIVAPILSILAWFAVGNLTGEQAAPAQAGQSYPLVEKSNCRYASGCCDLENEDFKVRLSMQEGVAGQQLVLRASHALEGVVICVPLPDSDAHQLPCAPPMVRVWNGVWPWPRPGPSSVFAWWPGLPAAPILAMLLHFFAADRMDLATMSDARCKRLRSWRDRVPRRVSRSWRL